ncbi:MAG: chromate transporter [Clostridiales bacterium]|jgi:chromate transporter|nr:chromate transporter [Clostridiales bacterium]
MLLTLFTSFFQIGLFAFGGGYAVIPLLLQTVLNHAWLTEAEFTNIVAISQITPGPIAINLATFVGFRMGGVPGSLIATFGVCLPSLILVTAAMFFIAKVTHSKLLKSVFHGLRPGAAGLIASAALGMMMEEFFFEKSLITEAAEIIRSLPGSVSVFSAAVFAISFFCMFKIKINPVFVILGAALAGIAAGLLGWLPV